MVYVPSLPSVTHSTQLAIPHEFKGQAFIPNHSSLRGGSGKMIPIASDTTTNIDQLQLVASNRLPAYDTPVPLIDNFKPLRHPPDNK